MKDPNDVTAYQKSVECLCVHIFHDGLDSEFEHIRGEILRKDPLLDFEETYAYVRRDAVQRTTLGGELDHTKSSAMMFQTSLQSLIAAISAPTVSNVQSKVFGYVAFVHFHKPLQNKLEPRALRCVFVRYGLHQKGYRYYHPHFHKIYVTLEVTFHEDVMYYSNPKSPLQEGVVV
ncbi:hypothetical protein LWI29_015242 [Acer saccharum]|uniref:Retroviral polymerase SH3-like domain-containing protein n=1 Tax=Acer saccharum TaxID=4024 RepID=A0AA39S884_ACESA|nr:hypothetical protein LWI29_015242 [Acer saccharum]